MDAISRPTHARGKFRFSHLNLEFRHFEKIARDKVHRDSICSVGVYQLKVISENWNTVLVWNSQDIFVTNKNPYSISPDFSACHLKVVHTFETDFVLGGNSLATLLFQLCSLLYSLTYLYLSLHNIFHIKESSWLGYI